MCNCFKVNMNDNGVQETYLEQKYELHNENGPAVIHPNGYQEYWIHGKLQKVIRSPIEPNMSVDKYRIYFEWRNEKGELHREDGPARIPYSKYNHMYRYWYTNGLLMKIIHTDGTEWHYKGHKEDYHGDKILHREDGPAKIWYDHGKLKFKEWWIEGKMIKRIDYLL
jgi:hypothetical protein